MAESVEKPVGAIAVDSRLTEEAGYSDDSTAAKPISKKKKTNRKRRYGESTDSYSIYIIAVLFYANNLGMLEELPYN